MTNYSSKQDREASLRLWENLTGFDEPVSEGDAFNFVNNDVGVDYKGPFHGLFLSFINESERRGINYVKLRSGQEKRNA